MEGCVLLTLAKQQFDKTIHRCKEQVILYKKLKELQEEGQLDDLTISQDILRGAIVLAVAAFDSYATDCFAEKFIDYIKATQLMNHLKHSSMQDLM